MIIVIAFVAGWTLGVTTALAVVEHIKLRRELKAAQDALNARETAPQPQFGSAAGQIHIAEDFDEPDDSMPRLSGVGPTAIRNREHFEREKAKRETTPKFAHPGVLNPDLNDIKSAAKEATNGGSK